MSHPHAPLMLLYALDAHRTEEPWRWWEYKWKTPRGGDFWIPCQEHPSWIKSNEYRRKGDAPPQTVYSLTFPSPP